MRRLLPPGGDAGEVDLARAYDPADRRPPPGRPWVLANMVVSADGATAVDGRSGGLSGPADRAVFHLLRSQVDLVLVGAGTVRAERYGPGRGDPPPTIAVVTASLGLDLADRFFTEARARPILVVPSTADPGRRAAADEVADVVESGAGEVDLAGALSELRRRGHRRVLCEGGPTLLGRLAADGLLDELCLTVSPHLVGGRGPGLLGDEAMDRGTADLRLVNVLEEAGTLLLRYLR